jgi:hypothetical protein
LAGLTATPARCRSAGPFCCAEVRDTARSINAYELCGDILASEVNALADAMADLAVIMARIARAGR